MKTVENEKLRVTVSDEVHQHLTARAHTLPGCEHMTIEQRTRGLILSEAMARVESQKYISTPVTADDPDVVSEVRKELIRRYLTENTRYSLKEILMRVDGNHRLSLGMQVEYNEAEAYARGVMEQPSKNDVARELGEQIASADKGESRRAIQCAKLLTKSANPELLATVTAETVERLQAIDRDNRAYIEKRYPMAGWHIEHIDNGNLTEPLCKN